MKREAAVTIAIAALFLVALCPRFARARNVAINADSTTAQSEAMKMVPARGSLLNKLDAEKMQPGHEFRVSLRTTVHLQNGAELPRGTMLIGTITTDDMQPQGRSELALRFSHAQLKDGKVIPIKATITGVYPMSQPTFTAYSGSPSGSVANPWSPGSVAFDQINAFSDIDMHSQVVSKDSGVLVSTKRHDLKLTPGTELALALAAAS